MESLENIINEQSLVHCYMPSLPNKGQFIHLHIYQIYIKSKMQTCDNQRRKPEHKFLIMTFCYASFLTKPKQRRQTKIHFHYFLHDDHVGSQRLNTVEILYSEIASINFNFEKAF